jgi:hypothetical protein
MLMNFSLGANAAAAVIYVLSVDEAPQAQKQGSCSQIGVHIK